MGSCCCKSSGYSKIHDPEYDTFPPLQQNYLENIYCRKYPLELVESNKNSWDTMRHFKIVFLGESKVGKTSIISQKVSYKFDDEYSPTIEDYYVKVHRINVNDINSFIDDDNDIGIGISLSSPKDNNNNMHSPTSMSSSHNNNESITTLNRHKGSMSFSNRYDTNGTNFDQLKCFHCILDIQDTSGAIG